MRYRAIAIIVTAVGILTGTGRATEESPCVVSFQQTPDTAGTKPEDKKPHRDLPFDYGGGMSLDCRPNEYSLGMTPSFQWGRYRLDGPIINLTVVTNDPYNDARANFSVLGLYQMGGIIVAGFFYPDVVGKPIAYTVNGLVLAVCCIFNSQHSFDLVRPQRKTGGRRWGFSAFAGTKTDYYPKWNGRWTEWVRINYTLGGEVQLVTRQTAERFQRLSLQSGVRWREEVVTIDGVDYDYGTGSNLFVSMKYAWGRRGRSQW